MTAPDMKLAADEYFDGTSLMDIRVLSTLGLTDDDIAALRHVRGSRGCDAARETDVMAPSTASSTPRACIRCPMQRARATPPTACMRVPTTPTI